MQDQNKKVAGNQKDVYLANLTSALNGLEDKLRKEIDRDDVSEFCKGIRETLSFFSYQRGKEKFGIPEYASLEINPRLSGFPTSEQMRELWARQQLTAEYVGRLPKREDIVKQASDALIHGSVPAEQIENLVKLNFYEELKGAELTFKPEVDIPQQGDSSDSYTIRARGDNIFNDIFFYLTMVAEAPPEGCDINNEDDLTRRLITNDFMRWNSRGAFLSMDSNTPLIPVSVERWVIGPYYCSETVNVPALNELFGKCDNPFLLRFRREFTGCDKIVEIERGGEKAKRAIASDETVDEYALCPYALEREFQKFFEGEGRPFTIYGV